jgi:pSer/pThr/pTyr-binding forkhead associated (FHA) protein
MKLIIEDDEGRKTVVQLVREEITIGRQEGNIIRLTERNVSRRHARLVKENGSLLIEDLGSYNGVRVNGEKITGKTRIKEGDLVEIGDYDLGIQGRLDTPMATSPAMRASIPPGAVKAPRPTTIPPGSMTAAAAPAPAEKPAEKPVPPPPMPAATAGGATAIIRVSDLMKTAPQVEARDLERSEMPRLVGLAGPFRGKEFYLMRTEVKFGRTDENDIVVDHQSVSRAHARFLRDDGQWKVIDNKSANGVHVNGEPYAVSNLNPGDTVELGHLKFRFCGPGEKFTPPPEKTEEKPGGLRPTTAELIAGAQGRSVSAPAAKKKTPVGLLAGVAALVLVLAVGAFFALRGGQKSGSNGELAGEDAVKAGDQLFKQRKYQAALDMYDKAGDAPAPNRKKATEEAKGEEAYNSLKAALNAGDADKARNLFDRCSADSSWWCQKATGEFAEPVKASYVKKHLQSANAAKTAGKLDGCLGEVNNVLGFDAANAEAQALQSQCQPQAAAPKEEPKREGPSQKEREQKAARLAKSAFDKLMAKDFNGAVKDAHAALAQNPADKTTLGNAYQSLGYGYAYLGDNGNAKKWLKTYLPFCTPANCDQVKAYIER